MASEETLNELRLKVWQAKVWLRLGLNFRYTLELKTTYSGWVAGEIENKEIFQLEVEVGA